MTDNEANKGPVSNETQNPIETPGQARFRVQTQFADTYYQFQGWPTWFPFTDEKTFAIASRISIGGSDGDVFFQRTMADSAMLDLAERLTNTFAVSMNKIANTEGARAYLPVGKAEVLETLEKIEVHVRKIRSFISKHDIIIGALEERDKDEE